MKNFLIVNAVTAANVDAITELCKAVAKTGCNLSYCHSKLVGELFAISMKISGSWDMLAKAENTLTHFKKHKLNSLIIERTQEKEFKEPHIPYFVQVVALDKPGIVAEICDFFAKETVMIGELDSNIQTSSFTGAQIFNLTLMIYIPQSIVVSELRERFILFSDALDLDAIIEPVK